MKIAMKTIKDQHTGHWFRRSVATTRRVPAYAYSGDGGIYFVTSDALSRADRVRYTIRTIRSDGSVGTVSEYRAYGSRARADFVAQAMAGEK